LKAAAAIVPMLAVGLARRGRGKEKHPACFSFPLPFLKLHPTPPPSNQTTPQTKPPLKPTGLMVLSLTMAEEGRYVLSGGLFAILLNMKHLFAYMAPVYFVYLLRNYCLGGSGTTSSTTSSTISSSSSSSKKTAGSSAVTLTPFITRLVALGVVVVAVFAASLGPFVITGQLRQLLSRLFPFGRGLCHAYWAPNAWAVYSFVDKLLAAALARAGLIAPPAVGHMAGGVVGVSRFAVLPQVGTVWCSFGGCMCGLGMWLFACASITNASARVCKPTPVHTTSHPNTPHAHHPHHATQVGPKASALCVLLSLAPCLTALWRHPHPAALTPAVVYANLCGFMWGYHVHEKAVITASVPLALLAVRGPAWGRDFLLLASAGHVGLFPLLLGAAETPIKWLIVGLYFAVAAEGLGRLHGGGSGGGGSSSEAAAPSWLPAWQRLYMAGLVPLELYCSVGHRLLLGGRLPFAPLMLTSVYCALGVAWVWGRMAWWYVRGCPGEASAAADAKGG